MHAAPMYIAETSPADIRGTLISLKEAFIVGGILVRGSHYVGHAGERHNDERHTGRREGWRVRC